MNKRLTKPHDKNVRIDSPLGLFGVPPDCCLCCCCCRMQKNRCGQAKKFRQ